MSKLDKHIAALSGERVVAVEWQASEPPDAAQVRQTIFAEIDAHQQLIPLDLRKVQGAPPELISVLVECQQYAKSKSKILRIVAALRPMQEAIYSQHQPVETRTGDGHAESSTVGASGIARSLIDAQHSEAKYDISKADKVKRPSSEARKSRSWKYYAKLASVGLSIACLVGAVEWFLVFTEKPTSRSVPSKSFEAGILVQRNAELLSRVRELESLLDENVANWRELSQQSE